jgi:phosphatidylglycerophosphate synthase
MADERRRYTVEDVRARTVKRRDAWWTVFLVDPIVIRVLPFLANHTGVTPNQLTSFSFAFGAGAAYAFWRASYGWLIVGAALYHVSFTFDCMDGKIARLKGTGSIFGQWLDWILDRIRVVICSVGLFAGQYRTIGVRAWYMAVAVIFLDMLRYMDALQVNRLRGQMREKIRHARREVRIALGQPATDPELSVLDDADDADEDPAEADDDVELEKPAIARADLHDEFKTRFGWYLPIRDWLVRWRVRPHLFSGIEFQMFIFIVAPLTGAIEPIVLASAGILATFEIIIVYKLWLSTRDFRRSIERIRSQLPPGYEPATAAPPPRPADTAERAER